MKTMHWLVVYIYSENIILYYILRYVSAYLCIAYVGRNELCRPYIHT